MQSLQRDGVKLFYNIEYGRNPPIIFIHGWCCDHTYFEPQFEHFARLGYSVVSVDLRGHGQSDKPHQIYTMQVFADDLVWMCGRLGLARPVFVGHSMGGIVAFDIGKRYPDLPSAVVMLDAAIALPSAARALISSFLENLRGPDYRAYLRSYVEQALFIPTDDQDQKARILDGMTSAPQHVMVSAFEGLRDFDPAEATAGLPVPGLYIEAGEPTARSDVNRLNRLAPLIQYGKTVGAGHFCHLEVPEQVNAMIERFLDITLRQTVDNRRNSLLE